MNPIELSSLGSTSARPSPVNRMMAAFSDHFRSGIDINMGVGYVNECAIPRRLIQKTYENVLSDTEKYKGVLNYGPPAGLPELIDAIRRWLTSGMPHEVLRKQRIIIGSSGATSLLEAAACLLKPGIVITCDPVYYIYTDLLERLGFQLLAIPEDDQGIDANLLVSMIDQLGSRAANISFIYLVTVSNPTCTILSNTRRKQVVEIVTNLSNRLGRKVPLLLDTAYEPLVHEPSIEPIESALCHDTLGIVHEIGSVSKLFAPALRIGYLIGQDSPFMAAMVQKGSDVALGPAPLNQHVVALLLDQHLFDQHAAANTIYRQKAKQIFGWLNQYLGESIVECRGGQAGFYFYLTLKETQTHERSSFYRFLTRTTGDKRVDRLADDMAPRVIYVPGEFCVHHQGKLVESAKRQLRLSYGYESPDQIEKAIKLIGEAIVYAQ